MPLCLYFILIVIEREYLQKLISAIEKSNMICSAIKAFDIFFVENFGK